MCETVYAPPSGEEEEGEIEIPIYLKLVVRLLFSFDNLTA